MPTEYIDSRNLLARSSSPLVPVYPWTKDRNFHELSVSFGCDRLVCCVQIGHILQSVLTSWLICYEDNVICIIDFRIWFAARSSSSFWIVGDIYVALIWSVATWSRNTTLCLAAYWIIALKLSMPRMWPCIAMFFQDISVFFWIFSARCLMFIDCPFYTSLKATRAWQPSLVSEWYLEITFAILDQSLVYIFNVESLTNCSQ